METPAEGELTLGRLLVAVGFAKSGGEAKRLIGQGAVKLAGVVQEDPLAPIAPTEGVLLAVGKRRLAQIQVKP